MGAGGYADGMAAILVIEDDGATAAAIIAELKQHGHEVKRCQGKKSARRRRAQGERGVGALWFIACRASRRHVRHPRPSQLGIRANGKPKLNKR